MHYTLFHIGTVWAFIRGNEESLYEIDVTAKGLKWSFGALFIAYILIGWTVTIPSILQGRSDLINLAHPLNLLRTAIGLLVVPILFYLLSRRFRFHQVLVPLIISYNWYNLVFLLLSLAIGAVGLVLLSLSTTLVPIVFSLPVIVGSFLYLIFVYFKDFYRLVLFVLQEPKDQARLVFFLVLFGQTLIALANYLILV